MKKKINAFFFTLTLIFINSFLLVNAQQLPQFSQYIFNGLHINPAYAGYKNESYIQSTYRSQWAKFPGAPKTLSLTGDFSLNEGKIGLGVSYLSDRIGLTESNSGLLTYSYRIKTSDEGRLALGLSAGISQDIFNPFGIITVSTGDTNLPISSISKISPKANAGLFYHNENFYAGFAAFNLIGKRSFMASDNDLAMTFNELHYFFTMGALVDLSEEIKLKPSFLVKHVNGAPTNYDLNAMVLLMDKIWLGASLRSNFRLFKDELQDDLVKRNALALMMEYFVTPNVRIGYAYDHNLNALSNFKNQSHELSLGFYIFIRSSNKCYF